MRDTDISPKLSNTYLLYNLMGSGSRIIRCSNSFYINYFSIAKFGHFLSMRCINGECGGDIKREIKGDLIEYSIVNKTLKFWFEELEDCTWLVFWKKTLCERLQDRKK